MKILYNNKDVSDQARVLSLRYESNLSKFSDSLVLVMQDGDGSWSQSGIQIGDILEVEEHGIATGKLFVWSIQSDKTSIRIEALSQPPQAKSARYALWKGIRFQTLVQNAAKRLGLDCRFYGCDNPLYPEIEQNNVSDLRFLSQLCALESCGLLVQNKTLIIYSLDWLAVQSAQMTIDLKDNASLVCVDESGHIYQKAIVKRDEIEGSFSIPIDGNVLIETAWKPTSTAEASRFAKGLLRQANLYLRRGSVGLNLDAGLVAGTVFRLTSTKRPDWDGIYVAYRVRHDLVKQKTNVWFRPLKEVSE